MAAKKSTAIFGTILIMIGGILLLDNLNFWHFRWDTTGGWVMFFLGAYFYYVGFNSKKRAGVVFPGTILVIYGLLFLACSWHTWNLLETYWPVFLLGPGLAFIVTYFAGRRETGLLVPGFILTGLAFIFYFREQYYLEFWPLVIILVGAFLIWKGYQSRQKNEHEQ